MRLRIRLTFSPVLLKNFVAACGLARSTAAYNGGFGVYRRTTLLQHTLIKLIDWFLLTLPSLYVKKIARTVATF